jgi:hypothetical protein
LTSSFDPDFQGARFSGGQEVTNAVAKRQHLIGFITALQFDVIHLGSREMITVTNGHRTLDFGYGEFAHALVRYYNTPDRTDPGEILSVEDGVDKFLSAS